MYLSSSWTTPWGGPTARPWGGVNLEGGLAQHYTVMWQNPVITWWSAGGALALTLTKRTCCERKLGITTCGPGVHLPSLQNKHTSLCPGWDGEVSVGLCGGTHRGDEQRQAGRLQQHRAVQSARGTAQRLHHRDAHIPMHWPTCKCHFSSYLVLSMREKCVKTLSDICSSNHLCFSMCLLQVRCSRGYAQQLCSCHRRLSTRWQHPLISLYSFTFRLKKLWMK